MKQMAAKEFGHGKEPNNAKRGKTERMWLQKNKDVFVSWPYHSKTCKMPVRHNNTNPWMQRGADCSGYSPVPFFACFSVSSICLHYFALPTPFFWCGQGRKITLKSPSKCVQKWTGTHAKMSGQNKGNMKKGIWDFSKTRQSLVIHPLVYCNICTFECMCMLVGVCLWTAACFFVHWLWYEI